MQIFHVFIYEEIPIPALSYGIYILLFSFKFNDDICQRKCNRYYETPCMSTGRYLSFTVDFSPVIVNWPCVNAVFGKIRGAFRN